MQAQALHIDALFKRRAAGKLEAFTEALSGGRLATASGGLQSALHWPGVLLIVLCCALAVLLVLLVLFVCMPGPLVKRAIETLPQELLGVEVTVGSVALNPCSLCLDIRDLKVHNPPSSGYFSDFMLKFDRVAVDLDARELLWRKHLVVQKLVFRKLYVIVEKHSLRTSNIKEALDFLHTRKQCSGEKEPHSRVAAVTEGKGLEFEPGPDRPAADVVERTGPEVKPSPNELMLDNAARGDPELREGLVDKGKHAEGGWRAWMRLTVREVKIVDLGLRFQIESRFLGQEEVLGTNLAIADIACDDCSKEIGECTLDDFAEWLLRTVLKTILTNVVGKRIGNHLF